MNKPLAWTVGTTLVGVGLYLGMTTATLNTRIEEVGRNLVTASQDRLSMSSSVNALEIRVRGLETREARAMTQLEGLSVVLNEIKGQQIENNRLLRTMLQEGMGRP